MTPEEAYIDIIHYMGNGCCNGDNALCWETLETAKKALEKQIPKMVEEKADTYCYCPNCEHVLSAGYYKAKFCPECGQKIDWSEL